MSMSYDRRIPLKSNRKAAPMPRRDFILPGNRWGARRQRARRLCLHLLALSASAIVFATALALPGG